MAKLLNLLGYRTGGRKALRPVLSDGAPEKRLNFLRLCDRPRPVIGQDESRNSPAIDNNIQVTRAKSLSVPLEKPMAGWMAGS